MSFDTTKKVMNEFIRYASDYFGGNPKDAITVGDFVNMLWAFNDHMEWKDWENE